MPSNGNSCASWNTLASCAVRVRSIIQGTKLPSWFVFWAPRTNMAHQIVTLNVVESCWKTGLAAPSLNCKLSAHSTGAIGERRPGAVRRRCQEQCVLGVRGSGAESSEAATHSKRRSIPRLQYKANTCTGRIGAVKHPRGVTYINYDTDMVPVWKASEFLKHSTRCSMRKLR